MRRFAWKLGRGIYMAARGEPIRNLPDSSGELYIQRKLAEHLRGRSDATILDVGGNLAQWTIQFLQTAEKEGAKVQGFNYHAFEPVPETRKKFTENVDKAGFGKIVNLHPLAVSSKVGETTINVLGAQTSGRNSIVDDPLEQETPLDRIPVKTTTIDAFCAEHGIDRIDFIKIDAEGHDYSVLEGASKLLDNEGVDAVQFEYTKRWIDGRAFLKDVFALIDGGPYAFLRIRPKGLELIPEWHPEIERFFAANYVLVHQRALDRFDVREGLFDKSNTYA
ncbi:FkbM family methyltransferase [Palleronia abyssalis]|nr:FkbM family methyltransferase [Palleronia abyssalis]